MIEIWKDITGYEKLYQVSNYGNIKSLNYKKTKKEKLLKLTHEKDGYYVVSINKTKKVHRLVAQEFIPNPNNKPCVNHINGVKDDNRVENLEWVTNQENSKHSYRIGLQTAKIGELNKQSKKICQYDLNNNMIKIWSSIREVQRKIGISSGHICECCKGKRKAEAGYIWKYYKECDTI